MTSCIAVDVPDSGRYDVTSQQREVVGPKIVSAVTLSHSAASFDLVLCGRRSFVQYRYRAGDGSIGNPRCLYFVI